jgi:hypothetical protein
MKSMLLIAPKFYEYIARIEQAFAAEDFSVRRFDLEPSAPARFLRRVLRRPADTASARHFQGILHRLGSRRFDLVFLIKADSAPPSFLEALRTRQPGARFVLYEWDSLARCNYLPIVPWFDRVFSFDQVDCAARGFTYLPLFSCRDYEPVGSIAKTCDVCFIGGYHESRDRIVHALTRQAAGLGLDVFSHMYLPLRQYLYLVFVKRRRILCHISFRRLSMKRTALAVKRSKVVIDVEHDGQNGISLRTIETLDAGSRLLTTNRAVLAEPFYAPDRISLIDKANPRLDPGDVDRPLEAADMSGYRLRRWVRTIAQA